jgi:hypothetical protein
MVVAMYRMAALWIIVVLFGAPMAAGADQAPGYEKYKEGYEGYLGDGILTNGEDEEADLARAVQNPVADMISLPLQNNTNFKFGPLEGTQNVLNIQPVVPIDVTEKWLMVTRTIVPVVSQPAFGPNQERELGLGDTLFSAFFSPKDRNLWLGNWLWGAGPAILLPTSTDDRLGPGEWGAGPSAVILSMRGRWVIGSLFSNVWSFTGDDSVNLFTWQPFVNYNLDHGWYLSSSPVITANWKADDSDDTWTVPLGGGIGRVLLLGRQPINVSLQGFYNVVRPDLIGPDWSIRFTIQFLFPKGRS